MRVFLTRHFPKLFLLAFVLVYIAACEVASIPRPIAPVPPLEGTPVHFENWAYGGRAFTLTVPDGWEYRLQEDHNAGVICWQADHPEVEVALLHWPGDSTFTVDDRHFVSVLANGETVSFGSTVGNDGRCYISLDWAAHPHFHLRCNAPLTGWTSRLRQWILLLANHVTFP